MFLRRRQEQELPPGLLVGPRAMLGRQQDQEQVALGLGPLRGPREPPRRRQLCRTRRSTSRPPLSEVKHQPRRRTKKPPRRGRRTKKRSTRELQFPDLLQPTVAEISLRTGALVRKTLVHPSQGGRRAEGAFLTSLRTVRYHPPWCDE